MATINTARIAALPDDYFADKKFTRDDLANALRALADELESPAVAKAVAAPLPTQPSHRCGERSKDGRVCKRGPGHDGRHTFHRITTTRRAPDRPWVPVKTINVANEDGSRSYPVKVPGVCSVWDDDTHRRKTNGWTILSAEQHTENGTVNVTVRLGRNGHARTVRLDRLVYRRPKGK